jgi:hypothetical protein
MKIGGKFRFKVKPYSIQRVYQITDWHMLAEMCAESAIDRRIQQIAADEHAVVIGTGDYLDCINYDDKRFDPYEFKQDVKVVDLASYGRKSFDYLYQKLQPIAKKIVGLGWGNHEGTLMAKTHSRDLWDGLIAKLGCADLGYCSFLDLVYSTGKVDHTFRVATHHGAGYAVTPGGVAARLDRFMQIFEADIVLTGHLHRRCSTEITIVGGDEKLEHLIEANRLGVIGSTYLLTYKQDFTGYSERKGYAPTTIGNPCITVQPETRKLGVEW